MMIGLLRIFFMVNLAAIFAACVPYQFVQPDHPDYRPVPVSIPPVPPVRDGGIFRDQTAVHLFQDEKARRVGDIITVVLSERTQATKSANTEITKDNSLTLPNPTLFGRPLSLGMRGTNLEMGQTGNREFSAESDSAQNNSLEGVISVTVSEVLPNGNLVVQGEKWINLNQGDEYIRLTGIVRPQDISGNNDIESGKIANARIGYSGTGALAESNVQGWFARFFSSPLWPF